MNLDLYISELLFDHDCVIIPGFGGIVANYRPSFLNPAHHTFSPPSKKLAFNASLRINDGLLANHLSSKLNISYQEAFRLLQEFVEGCLHTLKEGHKLTIQNVGELYFDKEHNLQFIPDNNVNYLKVSFGLSSIHSPSIKRGDQQQEELPFSIPRGNRKSKTKMKKLWRIIEVVPVAALLVWLVINPNVIRKLNEQAASFDPMNQSSSIELPKAKNNEKPVAESNQVTAEIKKSNEFELPPSNSETINSSTAFDRNDKTTEANTKKEVPVIHLKSDIDIPTTKTETAESIEKKTTAIAKAEIKATSLVAASETKSIGKMYYIIGGAFGVFENAEKFRDKLIEDGFQAAIIGQNDRGLHLVSLFSSVDGGSARKELTLIKEKEQSSAWLLHQ